MNTFKLDYDKKTLQLHYEGEIFDFNLDDGDVGDFWHSFTPKNGNMLDINFSQEDGNDEPIVSIYELNLVDGNIEQGDNIDDFRPSEVIGDCNNYFYSNSIPSGKVAKLVYTSLVTRVVVDEDATEEEIIQASKLKFIEKISNELDDNIEEIVDDEEMPYNKSYDV